MTRTASRLRADQQGDPGHHSQARRVRARRRARTGAGRGHAFAARGKFRFMQMEVGTGILPCGGGASGMARQTGLGRALEIILSVQDYDADDAERLGTINKALDPDEIGPYVDALARRIAKFPADAINACKQIVHESIDKPIDAALKAEAYWLYQATSKTPAVKRFTIADEQGLEHDIGNQRKWSELVMQVQDIN